MEQIFGGGAAWSFGSFIMTLVIGFFVGLLARALKPGDDKLGFFMTILLGIAGALLARFCRQYSWLVRTRRTDGFIASVIGAIVLLLIYGMVRKKK